jgi:hypothetical protein
VTLIDSSVSLVMVDTPFKFHLVLNFSALTMAKTSFDCRLNFFIIFSNLFFSFPFLSLLFSFSFLFFLSLFLFLLFSFLLKCVTHNFIFLLRHWVYRALLFFLCDMPYRSLKNVFMRRITWPGKSLLHEKIFPM